MLRKNLVMSTQRGLAVSQDPWLFMHTQEVSGIRGG